MMQRRNSHLPVRRARHTALLGLLAALLVSACSAGMLAEPHPDGPKLPPIVDSLVIEAVTPDPNVLINAVDLEMLRGFLREEFQQRPNLKTYDELPTKLANSVRVAPLLKQFVINEAPGEGIYVRSIDMALTVLLYAADEQQPFGRYKYASTYQRAYAANEDVTSAPFDLRNAMKELATQIVERLAPLQDILTADVPLESAQDEFLSGEEPHPTLQRGNEAAAEHHYDKAITLWSVVLFNPGLPRDKRKLFYISGRVLRVMRDAGIPAGVLSSLEPLRDSAPAELGEFKTKLREALGPAAPMENRIVTFADYMTDRIHRNLAAAHGNLATVYLLRRRQDLAAYHLALAHAHNPRPELLGRWVTLQKDRALMPPGMTDANALTLYQKVPPPPTVTVRNGSVDLAVLPPQVNPRAGLTPPLGAGGAVLPGAAPSGPAPAAGSAPGELRPVELPPQLPTGERDELKPVIVVPQS